MEMYTEYLIIGIIVFLMFFVLMYVVSSLGLLFYLKKMGDSNIWLAFVPLANSYKMIKIIYDGFKIDSVKTIEEKPEYERKRKKAAIIITLVYLGVSFIAGFIAGMVGMSPAEPVATSNGIAYETESNLYVDVITIAFSLVFTVLTVYAMTKSMVDKETGEETSNGMKFLHIILTIVTFSLYSLILMYYYGLSSKKEYKLSILGSGVVPNKVESDGTLEQVGTGKVNEKERENEMKDIDDLK